MKLCINCQTHPRTRGLDCDRCDVLLTLTAMVHSKWSPAELAELSKILRSASIWDLRRQRNGAILLQNLLGVCQRICAVRNLDADAMRLSLASRIDKQLAHMAKVAEHDATVGPDSYRKQLADAMGEAFQELKSAMGKKIERQPTPA